MSDLRKKRDDTISNAAHNARQLVCVEIEDIGYLGNTLVYCLLNRVLVFEITFYLELKSFSSAFLFLSAHRRSQEWHCNG